MAEEALDLFRKNELSDLVSRCLQNEKSFSARLDSGGLNVRGNAEISVRDSGDIKVTILDDRGWSYVALLSPDAKLMEAFVAQVDGRKTPIDLRMAYVQLKGVLAEVLKNAG